MIVKNIPETENFYSVFLGQPFHVSEESVVYEIGVTRVFFVLPKGEFGMMDKDKGGLNHIAIGVQRLDELKAFENLLTEAGLKHIGIKTDHYGNKEFIWFDDPAGIRVEIYCRPLE